MEVGVSIERAIELANEIPLLFGTQNQPLADAHDMVLAKSLESMVDDPRFDNSAMDGWAVKEADCINLNSKLEIIGTIQAGSSEQIEVKHGQACRIMTGAPIPPGADSIVMIEDSVVIDGYVTINGPARPHFIRKQGENLTAGEVGLQFGSKLKPAHLAMVAMMGHAEIPVIKPPKFAIIGTGDELVEPGQPLQSGQIYESNTTALVGLVSEMGCEPVKYPFVTDDLDGLRKTFDLAASECDAILTSGGVSMGEWDLVRRLMEEEGEVKFWRVLIKPGGPLLFGSWKGTPLFGLPGNPVSSQIVFLSIVVPWISNSCGYHPTHGPKLYDKVRVKLLSAAMGTKRKVTLRRIQIKEQGDILVGDVPQNQGSGNLRSMVNCNGLTFLPIGVDGKSGDIIDALWLR
jgi:molybdopterin molybdotransferase